jgi:capsular exopolysaccharide synthesis family protein
VNTIVASLLGLLVALGIVFLLEHLDDTIRSADEVSEVAGLATLGAIPGMKGDAKRTAIYRLVSLLYPRSPAAEAYRTLRTNIQFAAVDGDPRTLLVTSSVPGEGKTTTSCNLAVAFAQAGRRTLLIDADMRKPGVHQLFNLSNGAGLSTLFLEHRDDAAASLTHSTEQERLWILTSGPLPPNPAELLSSQRFRGILDGLRERFDLIVIDSPPVQAVTDAAILSALTDGVVFVIDAGRTRRGAVRHGRDALSRSGARILGAVLNRLSQRAQAESYYAYGSYSGYRDPSPGAGRQAEQLGTARTAAAPAATRRD